ncbi:MAG: hypothetical protein HMLIMOIP_001817 [Candidatus Nitrosomirales archaeon]
MYLNRIYSNKTKKIIHEPRESLIIPFSSARAGYVDLDVTDIVKKYSIPRDYLIELMIINLVREYINRLTKISTGQKIEEIRAVEYPIFPKEFVIECYDTEIMKRIEEENSSYQRISESYHAVTFLHQKGLFTIGENLVEALVRLDNNDYEGSIKFFRNVLDGLKNVLRETEITTSKNRDEALREFVTKGYHMLSNFGEHDGTMGGEEEARLARDITVALATYVGKSTKLKDVQL